MGEEFEYGVTDDYTVSLYVNSDNEHFRNPASGKTTSRYGWTGISLENKYLVLNPAENPVGLTLYLEPTYDGQNAELEQKIIIGQRHGLWKWAFNLEHETEWEDNLREVERFGPVRASVRFFLPAYEWYNAGQYLGLSRISNRDPGYYRGPQDPNHPYYHVGFRVALKSTRYSTSS